MLIERPQMFDARIPPVENVRRVFSKGKTPWKKGEEGNFLRSFIIGFEFLIYTPFAVSYSHHDGFTFVRPWELYCSVAYTIASIMYASVSSAYVAMAALAAS